MRALPANNPNGRLVPLAGTGETIATAVFFRPKVTVIDSPLRTASSASENRLLNSPTLIVFTSGNVSVYLSTCQDRQKTHMLSNPVRTALVSKAQDCPYRGEPFKSGIWWANKWDEPLALLFCCVRGLRMNRHTLSQIYTQDAYATLPYTQDAYATLPDNPKHLPSSFLIPPSAFPTFLRSGAKVA
jgi:hypothetical protein